MSRRTRIHDRLLLGQHEDVTYWFVDCPEHRLLKRAGRSSYEQMTAPVPAGWVLRFDRELLRRLGADWMLPLIERMARGEDLDLATVLAARERAGLDEAPVLDTVEWDLPPPTE